MRRVVIVGILLLLTNNVIAQGTIFDLTVTSATVNGKPSYLELTKNRSISFALYAPENEPSKLSFWINKKLSVDGELEVVDHKEHKATTKTLGGYETNFIWRTIDDNGDFSKTDVMFLMIVDPKGDRFVLETKGGSNKSVYKGFIKTL